MVSPRKVSKYFPSLFLYASQALFSSAISESAVGAAALEAVFVLVLTFAVVFVFAGGAQPASANAVITKRETIKIVFIKYLLTVLINF
jgi:hypothetical protein